MTDWVGRHNELGHPDWDFRRCEGMQGLVAYALRNDLDAGLGPGDVCRKVRTPGTLFWPGYPPEP